MSEMIHREVHGAVTVLRMERGKVNALDVELCEALIAALDEEAKGSAGAVVLTGAGPSFSAGVDLRRLLDGGEAYVSRFLPLLDAVFRAALDFPKPLVAAVNGHAIAGGCILAACCDHRVLVKGWPRMGVTELAVGVPFPALPLAVVASRCAPTALRDLVYGAQAIPAEEALAAGLCDELCEVDHVLTRALTIARKRAEVPPRAYALARRSMAEPIYEMARRQAPIDEDAKAAWMSAETTRAIKAYLDALAVKR